jgi:hypothetical protein
MKSSVDIGESQLKGDYTLREVPYRQCEILPCRVQIPRWDISKHFEPVIKEYEPVTVAERSKA